MLRGRQEEGEGRRELVTRDLLGGSADVDLELRGPGPAWERRLDPSSRETYLQNHEPSAAARPLHDLNFPPPSLSVGQKLAAAPTTTSAAPAECQSVCTLEKVRSALERESRLVTRPPLSRPDGAPSPPSSSSSSSSSAAATTTTSTSSWMKRRSAGEQDGDGAATDQTMMAVAVCSACLLYVLVSKVDPRCPKCAAHVPVNDLRKKPRIDLNFFLN